MNTTVLADPIFWVGCSLFFLFGLFTGAFAFLQKTRRKRVNRALMHLDHLFTTGQLHALMYLPFWGWMGLSDDSRVVVVLEEKTYLVSDPPRYKKEYSQDESLAGFQIHDLCLAAEQLRQRHDYTSEIWAPDMGRRLKARILKRRGPE